MDLPIVRKASLKKHYLVGPFHCLLMGDCESGAGIQYSSLLTVHDPGFPLPRLVVSAEWIPSATGRKIYTLCDYDGSERRTHGRSEAWGNPDRFVPKALEMVCGEFKIEGSPIEEPNNFQTDRFLGRVLAFLSNPGSITPRLYRSLMDPRPEGQAGLDFLPAKPTSARRSRAERTAMCH